MKLLVCAGGTGGHIFPGIAVAETLMTRDSKNEVFFVGTTDGMEGRIIPQAGFRLLYVKAGQFLGRSPIYKVLTLLRLLKGIMMSVAILRREKPDAILGMGGFTSVPVILAGILMGVPAFLHEQNVQPGLANKVLSKMIKQTFISFDETRQYLTTKKITRTGNPLRTGVAQMDKKEKKETFGVFIFGGSRGARSINDAVIDLLPYLEKEKHVVLYHQTGEDDYDRVRTAYGNTTVPHEVFAFTDEMGKYYSLADVVICRAGATTIFELAKLKKPAILIPYPYSAGGHQWKNAAQVEEAGGAYLVANEEATGQRLFEVIGHLMKEPVLLRELGDNIGHIYVDDAAERIITGDRRWSFIR